MKTGLVLFGILIFLLLSGCTSSETTNTSNNAGNSQKQQAPDNLNSTGFSGTVLAGNSAKLLDFVKADYDKALDSDKLIVLYFYANWCPICKEEVPHLEGAFNELSTENTIGFRVNYNDSETDESERELAREFGVAYQHTKVFVKNGQRVLKSPEGWDKQRYLKEINSNIG